MTALADLLPALPWRLLMAIGRRRGLPLDFNLRKAALVDHLAEALLEPDNLAQALADLSPPARQRLTDLLLAGGRLPARYLADSLRPPQSLARLARQPDPPADPLSPLEELCLLGLVLHQPATGDLVVPAELLTRLPQPDVPPPPPPSSPAGPAPVDHLTHDLAALLGLLERELITPLHGRWLPPRWLAAWGRHCLVPPLAPRSRSELKTGRRRFLHYLAESAGLLGPPVDSPAGRAAAPPLTPTPAAWLWLRAPAAAQRHRLWSAWTGADPDRWRAYRLPGYRWLTAPAALLDPLHQALGQIDPANPARFADLMLKRQPPLVDLLPASLLERDALFREIIEALLAGPLTWLGLLQPALDSAGLGLTAQGQAWLAGEPAPPPPPPARFAVTAQAPTAGAEPASFTLRPEPGLPDPLDLVVALALSESPARPEQADPTGYRLTPASVVRALHRGWTAPTLLAALERLADPPLTGQAIATLHRWARAAARMTLHQAVVLESQEPAVIDRLAASRRGRAFIQRTLSPRAVIVDPQRLEPLIRRLIKQEGVPPRRVGLPVDPPPEDAPLTPAEAGQLWLAVIVYQRLGHHLELPVRLPQSLLDRLSDLAAPADLAAAAQAAEQTLAGLERVIAGRAAFPPWPEEGRPVEESLTLIEQALAQGQPLAIDYYAASTNTLTHRQVEPYRLEWHGDTPYLIGFCRHVQAERMFRLDRIRTLHLIDPDS